MNGNGGPEVRATRERDVAKRKGTRTDFGGCGSDWPRGTRTARFGALLAVAALSLAATAANAADLVVPGCEITAPGQVGLEAISANIGDRVTVAFTVHADAGISVFGARINYPAHLLEYESTAAGDLTAAFEYLDGQATGPNLRIGGWSWSTYVPAGASGSLALISFLVIAAGAGEFGLADFTDDIDSYETDCAGIVSVAPLAWGRVKACYR